MTLGFLALAVGIVLVILSRKKRANAASAEGMPRPTEMYYEQPPPTTELPAYPVTEHKPVGGTDVTVIPELPGSTDTSGVQKGVR